MSIIIRKLTNRLRSKKDIVHKPSGFGKGKWHDLKSLWTYKRAARTARKVASASRARNRG